MWLLTMHLIIAANIEYFIINYINYFNQLIIFAINHWCIKCQGILESETSQFLRIFKLLVFLMNSPKSKDHQFTIT